MTKTHKAVLSTLAVLCLLFMGSGVAQAQECFAFQSGPTKVRAEGKTEAVGSIELQCRALPPTFGQQPIDDEVEISITLNTQITNATVDGDGEVVMGLTYTDDDGAPLIEANGNLGVAGDDDERNDYKGDDKEVLSDGGTTITWTISTNPDNTDDGITFPDGTSGMESAAVTIGGIMADASTVGDGNDVIAEVRVNGVMIDHSPIKLADVTTGLKIEVSAATGLQCDASEVKATIMFTEGFSSAIRGGRADNATTEVDESRESDELVLNFRGIPEGVTVTASLMGTGEAMEDYGTDLAPLMLKTGDNEGADEDGVVSLSSIGNGEIVYTFVAGTYDHDEDGSDIDDARADEDDLTAPIPQVDDGETEWNNLEITFTWKAGEPPLDMGTVTVSYDPVDDGTGDIPRYASGPTNDVITIEDCTTTLLFPYVTTKSGFDTGLVITNVSEGAGSCTIDYGGPDAPEDMMTPEDLAAEEQWVALLSRMAAGFQGYITASCEFRDAYGFAFITDGDLNLAQGYLAVDISDD